MLAFSVTFPPDLQQTLTLLKYQVEFTQILKDLGPNYFQFQPFMFNLSPVTFPDSN